MAVPIRTGNESKLTQNPDARGQKLAFAFDELHSNPYRPHRFRRLPPFGSRTQNPCPRESLFLMNREPLASTTNAKRNRRSGSLELTNRSSIPFRICLLLSILFACGCGQWKQPPESPLVAPVASRPNHSHAEIELLVIKVRPEQESLVEQMWEELDSQRLTIAQRKRLGDNGIRMGVAGQTLPIAIQQLIQDVKTREEVEHNVAEMATSEQTVRNLLRIRPSQRFDCILTSTRPRIAWLLNDDGYLIGKDHRDGRCELGVRVYQSNNKSVRFHIDHEILLNEQKPTYGINNGTMVFQSLNAREIIGPLSYDVEMRVGESLVMSSSTPPKGIGKEFFCGQATDDYVRKIVCIRLRDFPDGQGVESSTSIAPIETAIE
jgi:hypothetical protein